MKVKDLKKVIENLPSDMEVILQKDAEGNGHSPLDDFMTDAVYEPTCTWAGDIYDTQWTADDACLDEDVWQGILKRDRCLVLQPVN